MPYRNEKSGRIPNSVQESQPWRIHEVVPDFTLEDVWALPTPGDAGEFPALVELVGSLDPTEADSRATRVLWRLRDLLGEWLGLGRVAGEAPTATDQASGKLPVPGATVTTLAARLPEDLWGTAGESDFRSLPFSPLYRTDREAAAEFSNRTAHGVAHLAWVDHGGGHFRGQMAVYVKPRGLLGRAYMALIKPFRHLIVYPALMREFERAWSCGHPPNANKGAET